MKSIQTIKLEDIQVGDLVRIQNLQYYCSLDEVTELVEKFADKVCVVVSIDETRNEWGERTYIASTKEDGMCSFTDHEIETVMRIIEV